MLPVELKGSSVVVIGHFNPAMFHPYWFEKNNVITKDEAELAVGRKDSFQMILTGPLTLFRTEEIFVRVEENKMQIEAVNNVLTLLKDFVCKTFQALFSYEIKAFGYNFMAHYRVESKELYQTIGDKLAPKKYWSKLLGDDVEGVDRKGGLRQMRMTEQKSDDSGQIIINFEPSIRVKPLGVYIACNDHYNLKENMQDGQSLAQIVSETFDERMSYLEELQQDLLKKLINE